MPCQKLLSKLALAPPGTLSAFTPPPRAASVANYPGGGTPGAPAALVPGVLRGPPGASLPRDWALGMHEALNRVVGGEPLEEEALHRALEAVPADHPYVLVGMAEDGAESFECAVMGAKDELLSLMPPVRPPRQPIGIVC